MAPVNEPHRSEPAEFGDAWAELEPHLRRSLASAPDHVVDDVLQETSIKLLRVWKTIDHDRPALPLAVTIARNTLRDELRRTARHAHAELSEEVRVRDDLDAVVSARLELARVGSELTRLTPGQRAALLTEVGGGSRSPDTPRVKMLRARARARLRELVAQAGGFVATGAARLRSSAAGRAFDALPDVGVLAQALFVAVVAAGSAAVVVDGSLPRPERAAAVAAAAREVSPAHRGASAGAPATRGPVLPASHRPVAASPPADVGNGGGAGPGHAWPSAPLPRSKGDTGEAGYIGTEGYTSAGGGGTTLAGHDVAWRWESEYETPACVQRLADGQAPGTCEPTEPPSAAAEAEVDGKTHRVDTDRPRR